MRAYEKHYSNQTPWLAWNRGTKGIVVVNRHRIEQLVQLRPEAAGIFMSGRQPGAASPSLAERLVPWEETERERKQNIATLTELIADDEKELEAQQKEIKGRIAAFRRCRAQLQRQGPYC